MHVPPVLYIVQSLALTASRSPQALTFMVVEVVEPELQGPDTAGRENKQGEKERMKINSPPSASLFYEKEMWL